MIVSFHPIIEAHQNIICAGREPNDDDLAAIQEAEAVILPQGCSESLYRMARANCSNVFPNLDVRFDYPGKTGQIQLFQELGLSHPTTQCYRSTDEFHRTNPKIEYPVVVKMDWGGQGETVFKVNNASELSKTLARVDQFERSGQFGFLIQKYIPTRQRSLRVALIHTRIVAYWRIQDPRQGFGTGVAEGARMDHRVHPEVRNATNQILQTMCRGTGLQLAGFDFIFKKDRLHEDSRRPLIIEINYFFGRRGLGGSEAYYRMLVEETDKWLAERSLSR